jgi:hypothetical protein
MKIAIAAVFAIGPCAFADVGVVEATGAFQPGGASSTSYVSAIGAGQNPRLDGYDFGSVNVLSGQTLLLQNWYFENYAYSGGSTPANAVTNNNWLDGSSTATLTVVVKAGSSTVAGSTLTLSQTSVSGNNRFWQLAAGDQNTNLAAGLSNGGYTVEFTTTFSANQWTGSVSQFNTTTATSTASFTVIPAPGALALLGVAGLVSARRRR